MGYESCFRPEFFNNLADHGMPGINLWSFEPLTGVNGKPEKSKQHGKPVHKTGPVHIGSANDSVNNFSVDDRAFKDLLKVTSYHAR